MDARAISAPIVFGLVLIVVASAFYIPAVVDDTEGTRELVINQTETEEIQVYHELNATVSDINGGQDEITVVLEDTNTRGTAEARLNESEQKSVSIEGEDILVNASTIDSSTAMMEYTYPVDYGWPAPMKSVADNLGMIVMGLVAFLLFGWIWAV